MEQYIKLTTAEDLREFMYCAWEFDEDIGVHTGDNKIADAKSVLGLIALDYNKPVLVVTDSEKFIKRIQKWAVDKM